MTRGANKFLAFFFLICFFFLFSSLYADEKKEEKEEELPSAYSMKLKTHFTKENATLTFRFEDPVIYFAEKKDKELLLLFNKPIVGDELKPLENEKEWFESVNSGFKSLLLKTHALIDVSIDQKDAGREIVINLFALPDPIKESELTPEQYINWQLSNIRLQSELGHPHLALCYVFRLLDDYPQNTSLLNAWAGLEVERQRWQAALKILEYSHSIAPTNEDIIKTHNDIALLHRSYVQIEHEWKRTKEFAIENYDRFKEDLLIYCAPCFIVYAGAYLERDAIQATNVQRYNGLVTGIDNDYYRAELYTRFEYFSGNRYTYSIFAADNIFGLGIDFVFPRFNGFTELIVAFNRPYWGIVNSVVDEGVIDRIYVDLRQTLDYRTEVFLGTGIDHYGIRDTRNAATLIPLTAGFYYSLYPKNPLLRFQYIIDADYRIAGKDKISPLGVEYETMLLSSREDHNFILDLTYTRNFWLVEGYSGWVANRLGQGGTVNGLRYLYDTKKGFEFELEAYRRPSTTTNGQTVEVVRARLLWRF